MSECKHPDLGVTWGDSSAFYERYNKLSIVDGEYKTIEHGDWETKDGGYGDTSDQWLIDVRCEDCDRVYLSGHDNVAEDLTPDEEALVERIRSMGP